MTNSSSQSANVGNNNSLVNTVANAGGSTIEQDTYAILPSTIPYCDIVRAVLTKLGYTSQEMIGAKGRFNKFFPITILLMKQFSIFVWFLLFRKRFAFENYIDKLAAICRIWNIPNLICLFVKCI